MQSPYELRGRIMLRKLIFSGIVLMLLSACSTNTFDFIGETENWSAVLKVTQHSNDYEDQEFELEYRGDDNSTVGNINVEITTNAGGFGSSGNTLNENGVLKRINEANPANAKIL